VGNAGFDNAAVKGPADERIDVLTAQLSALTTAVAKIAGKPAHAQTGTTLYCYTHGWNLSHTGKVCQKTKPGHVKNDTSPAGGGQRPRLLLRHQAAHLGCRRKGETARKASS